jgi:hypothetical protein
MDTLEFAIAKILNCEIVHIPGLLDRRDIRSIREYTGKMKCRISIRCTDLEDMLWIFFSDQFFEEFCIFLSDIGNMIFESEFFEMTESERDDL